jgi:3-oxoacyl-[acyl-carrier-protein] synthase-1
VPPFSSTKGFTGHTLGAAGAVEAVISVLTLQHQVIFPNLNFSTPMKELRITPVTAVETHDYASPQHDQADTHELETHNHASLHHILSNSFGFGGNNSAIVLSKPTTNFS